MKIYTEIVLDWNGKEISSSSYEYDGEAFCAKAEKAHPRLRPHRNQYKRCRQRLL